MASIFRGQDVRKLIVQAKQGDRSSLESICEGLLPVVQRMCQTRFPECLKAKAGESDLVQESLLGAATKLASLQGSNEADLVAWMEVIVENKANDLRRRFLLAERRDISLEVSITQHDSSRSEIALEDSSQSPLDNLISNEQAQRLEMRVLDLPDHYRQIVQFRHGNGLTFSEIAELLGKSESAVKSLYVRAIKSLASEINDA
jgi:RNA polymerase sigma-70 factor (ECF subfamily)